jgi:hypothetical protein
MGLTKHPDMPDVPNAFDMVKSEEDRQVLTLIFGPWTYGRPLLGPEELRRTGSRFYARRSWRPSRTTSRRPPNLEIQPLGHEVVEKTVADIFSSPASVVERTRKNLGIIP